MMMEIGMTWHPNESYGSRMTHVESERVYYSTLLAVGVMLTKMMRHQNGSYCLRMPLMRSYYAYRGMVVELIMMLTVMMRHPTVS